MGIGGGGDDYRKGGGIHVLQAGGHLCVTGTKHGSKSQPIFIDRDQTKGVSDGASCLSL